MLHSHILLLSKLVISWIAVALSQASNGLTPMRVCVYLNQTHVYLQCQVVIIPDWTFNGTLIDIAKSRYQFPVTKLQLTIPYVQPSDEGIFKCVVMNTDIRIFSLVVLGTLQFFSSSESILNTRVLDTSVWVTNAGPGLYVAPTNFTLFAQGSSRPCCNQSEVQVPLPFFPTNTTYTLGHTNCTNVTCTYVATLQASPITSITPSAVFKTFTVTITPTDNIPTPAQPSPSSGALLPIIIVPVFVFVVLVVGFISLVSAVLVCGCQNHKHNLDNGKRNSITEIDVPVELQSSIEKRAGYEVSSTLYATSGELY